MTGHHQTSTETEQTKNEPALGYDSADNSVFEDLPPSAKLVHFVLKREDQRTQTELVKQTTLSARTVRTALGRLEDAGLVSESICLRDARKRVYSLPTEEGENGRTDIEAET